MLQPSSYHQFLHHVDHAQEPYGVPRALSTEEVAAVVQDFAKAAKAAVEVSIMLALKHKLL